jgi:hypothetical protein
VSVRKQRYGKRNTMISYYLIRPVEVKGYVDANGVYENRLGAFLGEVSDTFVEPYSDEDGDYILAPANWRELIIREL